MNNFHFDVTYQAKRSRLSCAFRMFLAIPIFILWAMFSGDSPSVDGIFRPLMQVQLNNFSKAEKKYSSKEYSYTYRDSQEKSNYSIDSKILFSPFVLKWTTIAVAIFLIVPMPIPPYVVACSYLMILFRKKYPEWWYDWNVNVLKFFLRFVAYVTLLTDKYPDTEKQQDVSLIIPNPKHENLSRWLLLIKGVLLIPHYIILILLSIFVCLIHFIMWLFIIIFGYYPRPIFDFFVGVMRWWIRVFAYGSIYVTDQYPSFSLK